MASGHKIKVGKNFKTKTSKRGKTKLVEDVKGLSVPTLYAKRNRKSYKRGK